MNWIIAIVVLLVGAVVGWVASWLKARADARTAGNLLSTARREAESVLRESKVSAQQEVIDARKVFEKETKQRRQELLELEKRIVQRELNLDRKVDLFDRKTEVVERREKQLVKQQEAVQKSDAELAEMKGRTLRELERMAKMTPEEAKKIMFARFEDDARSEAVVNARRILEDARTDAEREAKRIVTIAIERCASEQVQTASSCTVTLPNEEMKGRIIGREGRNIRAFEAATGVNILIDDTPQAVVLSGFDPVRRELARLTLETLISDGRINPARIEEEVERISQEIERVVRQAGEDAVFQIGLRKVNPQIVELLGRLKFRHSFAQNVLQHSMEVAHLEGIMAAELGLNQQLAKRVGLFHDIGKAVDHEVEGSHAVIGADLLRKFGEPETVWQGVACHHEEAEPLTIYGMLANAADTVSASRPGARSESMELYLSRLEKLETLATAFPGVGKCYALQAGREIRVMVEPSQVDDAESADLARAISKKIEQELQYPGQIRVTVVRETRSVEYAK